TSSSFPRFVRCSSCSLIMREYPYCWCDGSFGLMDGGVDAAISRFFGHRLPLAVRERILAEYEVCDSGGDTEKDMARISTQWRTVKWRRESNRWARRSSWKRAMQRTHSSRTRRPCGCRLRSWEPTTSTSQ